MATTNSRRSGLYGQIRRRLASLGFELRSDAERFLKDVTDRLKEYALELAPNKTRLIEFGRQAADNRRQRGERRPETFDFLGLTHYCRKTRGGQFGLGRKPIANA